jgi:hypothetical protein
MRFTQRLILLLASTACATSVALAMLAMKRRGRHHRHAQHLEHKEDLRSWENEGGNLAPVVTVPASA